MMSDFEEDLDVFPVDWFEHIAQNQQINGTATSGIIIKIPPFFDGPTSWFKYEELIDDWLDLTVLEAGKRGPALNNRLVGDAEMYTGLLDREPLRAEDGVKYFKDTSRPHCIKGAQSVFLWRVYQFNRARRGSVEMVRWMGKFTLLLLRPRDAWLDMLLLFTMSQERRQNQYLADVFQENEERQRRNAEVLDPNAQETQDNWYVTQVEQP